MSEPTTAPVTAEGLRERLVGKLLASWVNQDLPSSQTMAAEAAARDVDTILAALAGDPGDLPARTAAAINAVWTDEENFDTEKAAAAALSVRSEHAAHLAAELDHARAELSSRVEQHQRAVTRAIAAEGEVAALRRECDRLAAEADANMKVHFADRAERDALKVAVERICRAVVDTYGEDYGGEDVVAEVERLFGHLSEHDVNVGRLIGAKNEALERAQAERDNHLDRLRKAEGAYARLDAEKRDLERIRDRLRARAEEAETERDGLKAAIAPAIAALKGAEKICRYHGENPPQAPTWHGGCESCQQPARVRKALVALAAMDAPEDREAPRLAGIDWSGNLLPETPGDAEEATDDRA